MLYRCIQGLINRPALFKSVAKGVGVYALPSAPFGNSQGFSFVGDKVTTPLARDLLLDGSPSAIFRGIWAIVINTINRVAFTRASSYISKKCLKGFSPTVTHEDTAPAPVFVAWAVWIVAALNHIYPGCILRGTPPTRFTMPVLGNCIKLKAAATAMLIHFKITTASDARFTAIALANPGGFIVDIILGSLDYKKPMKTLAG
jgi:hypothetical protein